MKKIKILGTGNNGEYNYLIVEKAEHFFDWIDHVLMEGMGWDTHFRKEEYVTKKGKWVSKKKRVKSYIDKHNSYQLTEGSRIDLFYGKNKIFITFFIPFSKRKKLMEVIEKYGVWAKYRHNKKKRKIIS